MTESVFETRKLSEIYDEVREVYLSDNRPWILGFSGGKDSTCMVQLVWNAISDLPEKQKEVFLLSRIEKMKYREIAEMLGISVKAVEKRMHLALLEMKEKIGNV